MMKNQPLVSVMMTVYNQEEFIEHAINSILNQKTQYSFEIVIGEDCSQDKSLEICLKYQNQFPSIIRVIKNSKNLGILGNWDSTFSHCKGEFLALCEGDNYWTDEYKIEKQVNFLINNKNVGLVCSNYSKYYQSSNKREFNCLRDIRFQNYINYENYIIERNSIMSASVLMRKSIYLQYLNHLPHEVRYNWKRVPDTPLFLYFTKVTRVAVLKDSTAEYRLLDISGCRLGDDFLQYEYIINGYDIPLYFAQKLFPNNKLLIKIKKSKLNYAIDFWYSKNNIDKLNFVNNTFGNKENIISLRYHLYLISLKFSLFNRTFNYLLSSWRNFRIKYIRR